MDHASHQNDPLMDTNPLVPSTAPPTDTVGLSRLATRKPTDSARLVPMLVNPMAGSSSHKRLADQLGKELSKLDFQVEPCTSPEQLGEVTANAQLDQSLRCVIAVGGDGTLAAALNTTQRGTPLLMAPQGTENLLAKYMNYSQRASELARLVAEGSVIDVDAGRANGRLFTLMASVGFDAAVVHRVHQRRTATGRGNITHLSYAQPILEAISRYAFPRVRISARDAHGHELESVEGSWSLGSICRGMRRAWALRLGREATMGCSISAS